MKQRVRLSTALVLLVLATLFLSPAAYASDGPQATVNTAALNVRQGPGTDYGVVTVAHSADTLSITGRNSAGDWYFTGRYPTPGGLRVLNQAFINYYEKHQGRSY